jgi:hypothetical protein
MARGKQQRPHERLITREVLEARQADEARRRARRARGDEMMTTVDADNDDDHS